MGKLGITLIVFGWLSAYGIAVWRIAWTGELPQMLRRPEPGWRTRVALGVCEATPNRSFMPALIVFIWTGSLFLAATALLGASHPLTTSLGIGYLTMLVTVAVVVLFNRPKFIVPPYARDDPGPLIRWIRRQSGR